jgi:hypothetical protein
VTKLQTIKIFGKPFAVSFLPDNFDAAAVGLCEPFKNTITILDVQPPAEELDTVLHEVLHAIAHVMSIPFAAQEQEEQVVRMMGTGITGVLLENPDLVAYINDICQKVNANAPAKKK